MTWPADRAAALAKLWAEGQTGGEIAVKLGVSRNAVIGMANRMGLAARPSPIKRRPE